VCAQTRLGERLDDLDELLDSIALLAGEANELARSCNDGASLRGTCDVDPAPTAKLEQTLVAQRAQGPEYGIRIHAEDGREVAGRRETLARLRFALGDCASDLGRYLLVQVSRFVAIYLDSYHGASNTSSIVRTVLLPPRPPNTEPEERTSDPEALIEEARARQRRRRVRVALAFALATAIGFGVYALLTSRNSASRSTADAGAVGASVHRCPGGDLGSVAFVRGGALTVLDLNSCTTRVLVRSRARGPVQFSSDGRYVAFGGGFVATRGGPMTRTVGAGTWSPRKDVLAVPTKRGGLLLLRPHGPVRHLLPDGWGLLTLAFAPNGRTLAVSRSRYRAPASPPASWHQEIWLIDVSNGSRRLVFKLDPHTLAPPELQGFSPDGRWLLFWSDIQNSASLAADGLPLAALPVSGGEPITLPTPLLRYPDVLTWCGNTFVYVINRGGRQVTLGNGIAVARPPTWRSQTVLPAGGKRSWASVACPSAAAAARGGGSLVVAGGPTTNDSPFGQEHRSLWVVPLTPRAKPQRLTQANPPPGQTDELPMWSGDGRWILFVRTKPGGISAGGTLYALDPFGGNLVGPITDIGKTSNYYGSYSWPWQLDWHR
jgi:hypothetical protein